MKRFFAALALTALLVFPAFGQTGSVKSISALNAEVNSTFVDNISQQITPAEARQVYLDFIASFGNLASGSAYNITNDCASTPGTRAVIFICNNATSNAAGQNVGIQIWISSPLTATPGANNPIGETIVIDNIGRAAIWATNFVCTQQPLSVTGALGGAVHCNETDLVSSIAPSTPLSAFSTGSTVHGHEAVCSQNTGANPVPCQAAFWVWSAGDYANNASSQFQPFNFAFAAARVQYAGFDCEINPLGASDTGTYFKQGCVWDQSNSAVSYRVAGIHTSIIDVSSVTSMTQFVNCGSNSCLFAGTDQYAFNTKVNLLGTETGGPLQWANAAAGGQIWQMRENAGGLLYVYDLTNNHILMEFSTSGNINVPAVTTGTPAASLCIDGSNNIIKKTTAGSCV